jgi:hypothetical protein
MRRSSFFALLLLAGFLASTPLASSQQSFGPYSLTSASQCTSPIAVNSQATVGIYVAGTWTGTLQPKGSIQGQAAFNLPALTSSSAQSTITANGAYLSAVAGDSTFLLCGATISSGTVTVYFNVSPVPVSNAVISGPTAGGNPCANPAATIVGATVAVTGTSATQIVALSAGKSIYICSAFFGNGAGTTPTIALEYGTGSNCGTGTQIFLQQTVIPAGTAAPVVIPSNVFATTSGQAVCYILTGTTPTGTLTFTFIQQ